MLYPRIIPCLLVKNKGLAKTQQFKNPKYVGDPINAVKIFNEKGVDELIVLDIDATVQNREPDYRMINNLANECRMPLCYGGGIKTVEQAMKIVEMGVEKVAISSAAVNDPNLVSKMAEVVGNQSVVVILDVIKNRESYEIRTHNAARSTGICPIDFAKKIEGLGVGELVINSIDHDGVMKGYDLNIIRSIYGSINIPMTVLGGAGSMDDLRKLINEFRFIGAAAGSLFVFKGIYRAVLINYPSKIEKDALIKQPQKHNL